MNFKIGEKDYKKLLYLALAFTFLWGLAAHGYGFSQSAFSHDSLNEFYAADGGNSWKIEIGRIFVPAYRAVFRTDLTLPWMIGLLSLVWTGLAVYLVAQLLRIRCVWTLFLTAGIMTTNLTVISGIGTYMNDHDGNMLAMLCAVAAVWCWNRHIWGVVPGAMLVAASLGIYQSYVCVTITLVMLVCILDLLELESFRKVFCRGLRAVAMLLAGGILYWLLMKLVLHATGIGLATGGTNSLNFMENLKGANIPFLVVFTYFDCWNRLVNMVSPYPGALVKGIAVCVLALTLAGGIRSLCRKEMGWLERLLVMVLVALLPVGMNLMYIPTVTIVHDLMVYALWFAYLLALLMAPWVARWLPESAGKLRAGVRWVIPAMVLVLLYGNVQTANAVYLKKDLEQDAYLSYMTRVVYQMEQTEGYEPGNTPVVFVGLPEQEIPVIPGFERYRAITGADTPYVTELRTNTRAQRYFTYILSNPAVMADNGTWASIQADPRVEQMPSYPQEGCTALFDGVLVVKVGRSG